MQKSCNDPDLDLIFVALAEPNRRKILEVLARGSQSVETLAKPLGASTWNTLKHVRQLESAGLLTSEKVGRQRICHLRTEGLNPVASWTTDLRKFWSLNLTRLEEHLREND